MGQGDFLMKVLIASDSFKGSFTSFEVGALIETGLKRVYPDSEVNIVSVADGGEGTVKSIISAAGGEYVSIEVTGPLGYITDNKVNCTYGILSNSVAVIEMAESSGLQLVPDNMKNPLKTTTYGLGEQIKDAIQRGCNKIFIGIGGSSTNDLGIGMAKALGYVFLDREGNEVDGTGGEAGEIVKILTDNVLPELKNVEIIAMCDVTNPLCGVNGASYIYGPQKGATPDMVKVLDSNLSKAAEVIYNCLNKDVKDVPGAGAAGGLGAGIIAFCNGRLERGIEMILNLVDIDGLIKSADIVITGEGRIDAQTLNGKVPVGISERCKKQGKPCYAICGFLGNGWEKVLEHSLDGVESAIYAPCTVEEAIAVSGVNIPFAAERLFRIIKSVEGKSVS